MTQLHTRLNDIVGDGGLLLNEAVTSRSAGIWRSDTIAARTLVRPRSSAQVAAILAACNAAGQSVVTHGGRTGLVEGALTGPDDVVLSLERMNQIETLSSADRTATVQAGVVLQTLQERAAADGLMFPLDLGARGSCTVGGNISTNAGGNRVIRYGMTRDMVLGLEAVLADGTVLSSLNHMLKNNAGYDLKQLFIGSEGTLGVVTRAVLRLREQPASQETLLVGVQSFAAVTAFLKHMDRALGGMLSAFEVMWSDYYRAVTQPAGKQTVPLGRDYPLYVLVECMGGDPDTDRVRLEQAMATALEQDLVVDAVLARSAAQAAGLWAIRDDVEQLFQHGPLVIFDVSLPLTSMEAYLADVRVRMGTAFPDGKLFVFGHLGDGNLHLIAAPGCDDRHGVERAVYAPLAQRGGSVSAEHGIGLEKKAWLHVCRSPAEIDVMRRLKACLDPNNILNPGKIF